jgi:hypothetical protein
MCDLELSTRERAIARLESTAAWAMLHSWFALGLRRCYQHRRGPLNRVGQVFSVYGNSMKKSSAKKRIGRPPTGVDPMTSVRVPKSDLDMIDKLARDQQKTRSEIMRQLIAEALDARRRRN